MKRLLVLSAALLVSSVLSAPSAVAGGPIVVSGGGTGSWTPAGMPPASQFGMGLRILGGGAAAGHFECLMSGRSAFPGFQLMAVQGTVTTGTATSTTASFSGVGTLLYNFEGGDGRTQRADVTFSVNVTEGGPGVGTLQLTVFGVPFIAGGEAAFPPEWVSSGQIKVN
ncbi:MAG: hypothetical protein LC808_00680 [Actinobacteria bacterium]|nr:hypothetical protein [Actinomycetota bacterium]